uniref:Uncharacterized protein n=1 Tax=Solanum tuberosum TaxID=4113 RepID=M1D9K8_SOLTU
MVSPFRPVKSVIIRGIKVGCCSDLINDVLERATEFKHDYEGMATAQSLDDLKGWLSPLLSDSTPRWIEVGVQIKKKDLNVVVCPAQQDYSDYEPEDGASGHSTDMRATRLEAAVPWMIESAIIAALNLFPNFC